MGDGANVRPERGGFTVREVAQSAVEPTLLGEFVEVVLRVPLPRESAAQDVWAVPDDMTRKEIVAWLADEYPSLTAFVVDAFDVPGARLLVRLRALDQDNPHDRLGWLRDENVDLWGGVVGDAAKG